MSIPWQFIVAVLVVAVVAGLIARRRDRATRRGAEIRAADVEFGRERDFAQDREAARREALGTEGRAWEDGADRRRGEG